MCKCFIRGLKPEIEQRIARNLEVQETVTDALKIEKELQEMINLLQGQRVKINCTSNTSRENCPICHTECHVAINRRKLISISQPKPDLETFRNFDMPNLSKTRSQCHRFRDLDPHDVNVLQANLLKFAKYILNRDC